MAFIVEPQIEEYAEEHTSPDGELFERLAEETRAKTTAPQMMVGRIEGLVFDPECGDIRPGPDLDASIDAVVRRVRADSDRSVPI